MPHRKPTDYDRECGRAVAALRRAAQKSQTQVGEHVGLTSQQVSKYERGMSSMTLGLHHDMCMFLQQNLPGGFAEGQVAYSPPVYGAADLVRALQEIRDQADQALRAAN